MHQYSVVIRIICLWKYLKLKVFFVYVNWFHILLDKCQNKTRPSRRIHAHISRFKEVYSVLCRGKKALRYDGHSYNLRWQITIYGKVITPMLYQVVNTLWLCEKVRINAEFCAENDKLQALFDIPQQSLSDEILPMCRFVPVGKKSVPFEMAYKLSEKLPVRKELSEQADKWFNEYIKGDWVAVHYRGTDIEARKATRYIGRYKIDLEPYITYLRVVLDNKCSILVCSDQAQFIEKMKEAFPGRVFARDIPRSSSREALHRHPEYKGIQQQQDALIDMLILAKASLIYTTGSAFVDVVRYFNPKTKIVSLDGRKKRCYMPIPKRRVFNSLKIK